MFNGFLLFCRVVVFLIILTALLIVVRAVVDLTFYLWGLVF